MCPSCSPLPPLVIFRALGLAHPHDHPVRPGLDGVRCFYFEKDDDFPEVRQFVHDTDTWCAGGDGGDAGRMRDTSSAGDTPTQPLSSSAHISTPPRSCRAWDRSYGLGMSYLRDPDFKAGLEGYLAASGVTAILLGTRR